jgi:hypothetical protein
MSRPVYLKLNSIDRENASTTTPGKFRIKMFKPITGLRLKDIYMPLTAYNVSSTNNTVYFYDTAARVAVIPPGYYSYTTLFAALASAMTSAGAGTYTASLVALSQAISISSTVSFSLTFSNTVNSMAEILGFPAVNRSAATVQIGASTLNLATPLSYNIDINGATGTLTTTTASTSFVIPVLSNSVPSELYFPVPTQMPQSISFPSTRTLEIGIYDDSHRLLNIGTNWYMTCEATYE